MASPTSRACRAAKVRNPPIAANDVQNPTLGAIAARCTRRTGAGSRGPRVSPSDAASTAAATLNPAAPSHAAVNPPRSTSTSPSGGPNASPR
nr:hypothetical protein GCM10017745_44610 [Saccharothrix mutabilis subsp. capreolus]